MLGMRLLAFLWKFPTSLSAEQFVVLLDILVLSDTRYMFTDQCSDCCAFKFLQHSVDRKYFMHFQSEYILLKFCWHSVDGT